jgi:hypothetical protein
LNPVFSGGSMSNNATICGKQAYTIDWTRKVAAQPRGMPHVFVGKVFHQFNLAQAPLGVQDVIKRVQNLLNGYFLACIRILCSTVETTNRDSGTVTSQPRRQRT